MNVATWLDSTRADFLYGLRQLGLNPGFASVAVLSLALGIGANTTIFQLVNAIRLKTLPVNNPHELVSIDFEEGSARYGGWWGRSAVLSYPQWEQIRTQQRAFTGVVAWSAQRFNLSNGGEPRFAESLYVNGDFFHHLGVPAILGRTFTAQDDGPVCNAAAVISYSFWQREFGGDPGIVGRSVSFNGFSFPILGVTAPVFFGVEVGKRYDAAVPLCAEPFVADERTGKMPDSATWWLSMMGRLKPGWTTTSATAHLHSLSPGIMRATLPVGYRPDSAKLYLANRLKAKDAGAGISGLREQFERPLWLLMAATTLVLLISCANLANLLLARAAVRQPEIAMRLALGASRSRLIRQLLAESLLLAASGAALGAALALILSRALIAFINTPDNPTFVDLSPDWRTLAFTASLAVFTCLLFGLLPAVRATYLAPVSAMRAGVRSVTAGRERSGFRQALVATQVALSFVLLFGAMLFVRSLHNLLTVDAGFRPEGIVTVSIDFSQSQYPVQRRLSLYREFSDRLSSLPGAVSVAQVSMTPVTGGTWNNLVGADSNPAANGKLAYFTQPGPGYFKTMATALIAGREFNDRDTPTSPKVAIVNEMFARTFFNGANPVGHTFRRAADAGQPEPVFQIVGLVKNTKYGELRENFQPIAFFPIAQSDNHDPSATYVVRISGAPSQFMSTAKRAIAVMSPTTGIEFHILSAQLQESLARDRLMAMLSGGFGFLAGLLATLGLYGVISYLVAQRRNEIGIRMALGANRKRVICLVLREALLLVSLGLLAGVLLALWAGRAAASLLFGLQPHDLLSLVSAAALLAAIALVATYIPARRAAAVEPVIALRSE